MPQLHAIIYGRVQGVSFRAFTVDEARRLGLVGWVRNQTDGSVQTTAVGPRASLEAFAAWLHRGSPAAQVTQVSYTIVDNESETFAFFDVRYYR